MPIAKVKRADGFHCFFCNASVEGDATLCPGCGKELLPADEAREDIPPATSVSRAAVVRKQKLAWCVHCHKSVSPAAEVCPHCGQPSPASTEMHWSTAARLISGCLLALGLIVLGVSALLWGKSCSALANQKQAVYVKDVTAYKEGSGGLMVYFVLADADGAMTTSDGTVTLVITQTRISLDPNNYRTRETDEVLYSTSFRVRKNDFRRTKIGLGAFARDGTLYPVGRITYSAFSKYPSELTGKVRMWFQTADGRTLEGEGSVIF